MIGLIGLFVSALLIRYISTALIVAVFSPFIFALSVLTGSFRLSGVFLAGLMRLLLAGIFLVRSILIRILLIGVFLRSHIFI